MSGPENLTVADILERAADLIEPEGAWTQGCSARDDYGESVPADHPTAVCFCAGGAISRAAGYRYDDCGPAWDELERAVSARFDWWNDTPGRTQAEVVAKLREAAARARAEQVSA